MTDDECSDNDAGTTIVIKIIQSCYCDKCIRIPRFIVVHQKQADADIIRILGAKTNTSCKRVSLKGVEKVSDIVYEAKLEV